jgi:hypothetical protein
MQLADPAPEPSPKQVQFDAGPASYTKDAIQRLDTVDSRMHYYAANSRNPTADPYLEFVWWSDVTDREHRKILHPRTERPGVTYASVDGEWSGRQNQSWKYNTWAELSTNLWTPRDYFELPEESSAYSVERNTNQVVVVRVNRSVLSGHRNATAFVTIEKETGNVRQVRQRTRKTDNNIETILVDFDHYGDVDVSRPPEAEYTPEVVLYDLLRGPIPLHEVF